MKPIAQYRVDRVAATRAVAVASLKNSRPKGIQAISPVLRQAAVVSIDSTTPPTCTVQYDTVTPGPTHPLNRYPAGMQLVAGDLVYVAVLGNGDAWVITKLAGGQSTPVQVDVATSQGTTSTSYTDLATAGPATPALQLTAGQPVRVTVSARMSVTAAGGTQANMSFAVSGDETFAAVDTNAAEQTDSQSNTVTRTTLYVPTVTGVHTFTAKYKVVGATTANFLNRRILVEP